MKKIVLLFLVLVALAGGVAFFNARGSGGGSVSLLGSKDQQHLKEQSLRFLEDLKFKDFRRAASYHSAEDRKKVNIPQLIERMFAVKPESLDIMRYEVLKVELDSTGDRARVKTHTVCKVLNANEIKEPEIILYWFRDPTEGWVMELESSLQ